MMKYGRLAARAHASEAASKLWAASPGTRISSRELSTKLSTLAVRRCGRGALRLIGESCGLARIRSPGSRFKVWYLGACRALFLSAAFEKELVRLSAEARASTATDILFTDNYGVAARSLRKGDGRKLAPAC